MKSPFTLKLVCRRSLIFVCSFCVLLSAIASLDVWRASGQAVLEGAAAQITSEVRLTADDAAPNSFFGVAAAISGDTAVVGSFFDATSAGEDAGSAYVFVRDGDTWTQQAHLFAPDAAAGDNFGISVAISGDTIVIGSQKDDTAAGEDAGSIYIFYRNGGAWNSYQKIENAAGASGDLFGRAVALEGDTLVVGANGENSGAGGIHIIVRQNGTWTPQAAFQANGAGGSLGNDVAISGNTIVAGAFAGNSAFVFVREGDDWSQQAQLSGHDSVGGDFFGQRVAIDGESIVVGAPNKATAPGASAGVAYVFVRNGATWTEQAQLSNSRRQSRFGDDVAISRDVILVGAPGQAGGLSSNRVHVFARNNAVWSEASGSPKLGDTFFGRSVALDNHTAIAGATAADSFAGSALVFNLNVTPFARDDSLTVREDPQGLSVGYDLLANDADPDGDALTITDITQGAHGSVSILAGGTRVDYRPQADFNGSDSFTYTVSDGHGGTATATVNVTITPVNDAPVIDLNGGAAGRNYEASFNSSDAEIPITDASLTIGDVDGDLLMSATLLLQNRPDGNAAESLAVTANLSGTGLTASYNPASGVLTISGAASPATYESVLRSAVYRNSAATKSDAPRTITFSVSDGTLNSLTATTTTFRNVLHIENSSVRESNSGTSNAVVFVRLDRAVSNDVQVAYRTQDGTAHAGSDYLTTMGVLTIFAGNTSGQILVPVIGDTLVEDQETFTVRLSNPVRATLDAADTATVFVQNDDGSLLVNTVADVQDPVDGKNSLREAISFANANPGPHTITFDLPANEKNADGVWEIVLTSALPPLGANPTTISGPTSAPLVVRRSNAPGTPLFTVFRTFNTVTISNLTISGGDAPSDRPFGGGIFNGGTLTLTSCTLTGNRAPHGGGLYNQGTLQMTNCTLSGNTAQGISSSAGGGFYNNFGDATITNCTITDNTATTGGGAARNEQAGTVSFRNTIVAANRVFAGGSDADLAGVFTSGGFNLLGDAGASIGFIAGVNNDQVGGAGNPVIDPRLAALAANGGVTLTHALLAGSPAIDAASEANFPVTDQRGVARPIDGNGDTVARCDIGAFETPLPQAPPDAINDAATVAEDSGSNAINVLANDTRADGNILSVTAVTQGTNGSVEITGGGTGLSYTPNANYNGSDSFTYAISDGNGGMDTASVSITVTSVNDNPTANGDVATVSEDSTNNSINVLANDSFAPDTGETLSVTGVSDPPHGAASFTAAGVTYTPDANFFGNDSFTYSLGDGNGGTQIGTISVTVTNVNDSPDATNDHVTVNEDSVANSLNVLANDLIAPDTGETLTVTAKTNGANGTVTITGGGTNLTYTPAANFFGTDTFIYTISDGNGGSDTATVNVSVTNVNDPPDAVNDSTTVNEDSGANMINVRANDLITPDPGETLTVTVAMQGTNGAVAIIGGGTGVSYTPNPNFSGSDSFTYTISDGNGGTDTAMVSVIVSPANDAPVFTSILPPSQTVQYSDAITPVNITAADVDNMAASLALTPIAPLPGGLTLTNTAPGAWTLAGNALVQAGTYNIGLKVADPFGASNITTVTVVVNKEQTATAYTGDAAILTSSPSITTVTVRLGAHLDQQADGAPGDITRAKVTFELFKSNNFGDTPDRTVAGVPVNASGDALTTLDGLAAETYTIKVKIDTANTYWTANPVGGGVLNVTVGTNDRRTSGGGWIADAGSSNGRGNFGFTVRPGNNGTPKGNAVYVFRATDLNAPNDPKVYDWVVKSNSWQGGFLNFAAEPGSSILTRSSFKGRCNVQKIDPATGQTVVSLGGYTFTVDGKDGNLLNPLQPDAYAITILDGDGVIWRRIGTNSAPVTLGGGNLSNRPM